MIYFYLTVSAVLNVLLVWYLVKLLRRLLVFQDDLDNFSVRLEEYNGHVDIVYNLERFYGDETLLNLLRHSKGIAEECMEFRKFLNNEEEEENDAEDEI
tara:strand:+ start:7359 stop:7655 length:297 start_codon:yes stop_codon:yes gene_type:complete